MIHSPNDPHAASPRRSGRLAALMLVLAFAAAACGSGDNNAAGNNGTDPGNQGGGAGAAGPEAPVTVAPKGPAKRGGTIHYGTEAEVDGFNPTKNRWAITGILVGMAIFDPLAVTDKDGKPQPYLAEKWEPSPDNKEWIITLRKGIKFHNGEPLNADAVTGTYVAHTKSFLTNAAITNIDKVESLDELRVKFTMKEPWATFPSTLTGQVGVIPAPAQLAKDNGDPQNPIGTGPFKLKSRTVDKETVLERNPDYWQKDKAGVQLPYLDGVTFEPVPDDNTRINGLRGNQFQLIHTTNGPGISAVRSLAASGEFQKVEDQGESEEGFVLLNLAKAPFDDIRVRRALAMGLDRQAYIAGPGDGVNRVADNVFDTNSPWYTKVDYPAFDEVGARKLVDEYEAEKGPIKFKLQCGGTSCRQEIEFMQGAWNNIGMEVTIETVEQTKFILDALAGNFDANEWRQWGEVDPDQDYLWWISENAKPIGESSLNIGRNKDPIVDEALRKGRSTTDVAERKKAYDVVQQQFAKNLPYIWTDHSTWVIGATNDVRGITNGPLPSGQDAMPIGGSTFPSFHRLTYTWLER